MSFDANSDKPLIEPRKKSTQVNLWMSAGVGLFFIFALATILWIASHRGESRPTRPEDAPPAGQTDGKR